VLLLLEVDDPDDAAARAVAAGAEIEMPVQEMFFGERYGVVRDPFGHRWALSTAREQLTPDDITRRTPPDV
jgi:PhnB protein